MSNSQNKIQNSKESKFSLRDFFDSDSNARYAWYVLLVLNIAYILWTDIFPFQDMPQHLSYATIMAKAGLPGNNFDRWYEVVAQFSTYHTYHWVLAGLGQFMGIEWGHRLLLVIYVLTLAFGLSHLMDTLGGGKKRSWFIKLLIQFTFWNATIGMGFMPFVQSMAAFPWAVSFLLRLSHKIGSRKHNIFGASVALIFLSITHIVCSAAVVFFMACYTLFDRREINFVILGANALFFVVTAKLYGGLGSGGLTQHKEIPWDQAFVHAYDWEFITNLFNATWSPWPVTVNYLFWNFVGPYKLEQHIPLAISYFFLLMLLSKWNSREDKYGAKYGVKEQNEKTPTKKNPKQNEQTATYSGEQLGEAEAPLIALKLRLPYRNALLLFFFVSLFLPWGIYIPSEITFINYRLLTLTLFLLIPFFPDAWARLKKQRIVITVMAATAYLVFVINSGLYQGETKVPIRLIERVPPGKILGSVMFANKSRYFAKILDLTHFMPMFHTIRQNGINGQFWACYAPHLPVCYKRNIKLNNTPDWHPWKFKAEDLLHADYLLFSSMYYASNPIEGQIKQVIHQMMDVVECSGEWCLYRKK